MMASIYPGLLLLAVVAASVYAAEPAPGGDRLPGLSASQIWNARMGIHRDDWCFMCVNYCHDQNTAIKGIPNRIKNSVSNFPKDSRPQGCPELCTESMRSFLRTSIFEIVLDLMNALRLDDPRRKQLPDLAKETIDNKRSYSCTGGDVVIRRTIAHPSRQRLPLPQLGLEDMRGPGQTLNFQLEQEKKSQAYLASTAERPPSRIPVRGRTQGLGSLKMSWGEVVRLAKQGLGRMWTSAGSALNEAGKSFGAGGARNGPMPNRPMKPI